MALMSHEWKPDTYLVRLEVKLQEQSSIRLDRFLKDYYRRRSREQIKCAIEDGRVELERTQSPHLHAGKLKPSTALVQGDRVLITTDKKPEPRVNFNYTVLYDDPDILVIAKPANLPVHPAGRYFFNTLLVHLRTQGHRNPLDLGREYFLVHRIDKETSGVLVLAKNREVCAHLVAQFASRQTKKQYFALVRGIPPETFEVAASLARDPTSNIALKMAVIPVENGGLEAYTGFRRLSTHGDFSLVECFPRTGRQHQIRVHLDHAGHPIVGDKLYGMSNSEAAQFYDRRNLSAETVARLLMPRHCLHAGSIEFTHPKTLKMMRFESHLPEDMTAFMRRAESATSLIDLQRASVMTQYMDDITAEFLEIEGPASLSKTDFDETSDPQELP